MVEKGKGRAVPLARARVADKLGAALLRGDSKLVISSDTAENRIVMSDARTALTVRTTVSRAELGAYSY